MPSTTAQVTTLARAALSARGGPVRDQYARLFLETPWRQLLPVLHSRLAGWPWFRELLANVGGRTIFFDETIQQITSKGITQVVIVGAGYDSRAIRFARPGLRFFEVDQASTQVRKRFRLANAGYSTAATLVAADLTTDCLVSRLKAAGFDRSRPAFFLCEGVFEYLDESAVRMTLRALRVLAAAGSLLAFDPLGTNEAERPLLFRVIGSIAARLAGEQRHFRIAASGLHGLLAEEGWLLHQLLEPDELYKRYLQATAERPRFAHNYVATAIPTGSSTTNVLAGSVRPDA